MIYFLFKDLKVLLAEKIHMLLFNRSPVLMIGVIYLYWILMVKYKKFPHWGILMVNGIILYLVRHILSLISISNVWISLKNVYIDTLFTRWNFCTSGCTLIKALQLFLEYWVFFFLVLGNSQKFENGSICLS